MYFESVFVFAHGFPHIYVFHIFCVGGFVVRDFPIGGDWQVTASELMDTAFDTPCGTISKALEKPIPRALLALGAPNPAPKRSEAHPWGRPGLQGLGAERVATANRLAVVAGLVAHVCVALGI